MAVKGTSGGTSRFFQRDHASQGPPASQESDCTICLSALRSADRLGHLGACGHAFCLPCLRRWAEVSTTCPLCKAVFTEIEARKPAARSGGRGPLVEVIPVEKRVQRVAEDDGDANMLSIPDELLPGESLGDALDGYEDDGFVVPDDVILFRTEDDNLADVEDFEEHLGDADDLDVTQESPSSPVDSSASRRQSARSPDRGSGARLRELESGGPADAEPKRRRLKRARKRRRKSTPLQSLVSPELGWPAAESGARRPDGSRPRPKRLRKQAELKRAAPAPSSDVDSSSELEWSDASPLAQRITRDFHQRHGGKAAQHRPLGRESEERRKRPRPKAEGWGKMARAKQCDARKLGAGRAKSETWPRTLRNQDCAPLEATALTPVRLQPASSRRRDFRLAGAPFEASCVVDELGQFSEESVDRKLKSGPSPADTEKSPISAVARPMATRRLSLRVVSTSSGTGWRPRPRASVQGRLDSRTSRFFR